MKTYQRQFIEFAMAYQALRFGEFKLKSGRLSPYFFNSGMFNDGGAFYQLGLYYANTINDHFAGEYDVLYGPAYKGIPLVTAASIGLKLQNDISMPVSFNRKEVKDHGEGGNIVGASLTGKKVLLIDDVITAGTAIKESVEVIQQAQGKLVGVVIALNRQERGLESALSAIEEVQQKYQIKVASIISLEHLIAYLQEDEQKRTDYHAHLTNMVAYRKQYGTV